MSAQRAKTTKREEGLSLRDQYCVVVSATVACGKREVLHNWIRRGLEKDRLPRTFFEELFIHLSLLVGFPGMLDCFERLHRIRPRSKKSGRASTKKQDARSTGMRIISRLYGEQTEKLLQNLTMYHPEISRWIVEDVYGRVFGRAGLTLKERELANLTVLSIQGLRKQFYSHIRGALHAGVSPTALCDVLSWLRKVFDIDGELLADLPSIIRGGMEERKK